MNYAYVWHAPFNHIVEFISDLSINGYSYRTVHCRLSAISYFNKVYDLHDCTKNFIVRKMLGLRRIRRSEDTRYPISLDLLWHIVSNLRYVCHSIYETSFFVSIFRFDASQWIHFHEFRRIWKCSSFQWHTLWSTFRPVTIESIEKWQIWFRFNEQHKIDPENHILLQYLTKYYKCRPTCNGQALCHFDGSAVTLYQFNSVLKKVLEFTGCKASHFSSHSFRIGRTTDLFL